MIYAIAFLLEQENWWKKWGGEYPPPETRSFRENLAKLIDENAFLDEGQQLAIANRISQHEKNADTAFILATYINTRR